MSHERKKNEECECEGKMKRYTRTQRIISHSLACSLAYSGTLFRIESAHFFSINIYIQIKQITN